ncbi:DUF6318 family protein [Actinotalea sp. K2]|uniref:DUF6318 family protein n=1 Tax=Actinotalea sp. K2 TaxID=2939438 RepID=UPI0020175F91|nr:DUF6318 family protein [Actinotalea sp. K2]MCL3859488.1 DUF6318 family protein [Actinotalea sp. K2]
MRAGGFVVIRGACRATGAAVAVAVLLAGCAQEPRPQPTFATLDPLPTPSPTPTVEPVTKPERPAEMDRTDEVGAAAAAEYFMSLYPYVLQTGDLTEWDAMTAATCGFCTSTRDRAARIQQSGGSYTGGAFELSEPIVHPLDDLVGGYPVDLVVRQFPSSETDGSGNLVATSEDSTSLAQVDMLHYDGTGWHVLAVALADSSED